MTADLDKLPLPPLELANRVGSISDLDDPWGTFLGVGALSRREILAALPDDWSFDGRRVLDFGCGAGRTLRHFAGEADRNEVWGCDIDDGSVRWLHEQLCPPFHAVRNEVTPSGVFPDSHFSLIWAISVFTHLTDSWSAWLCDLHRMLEPGGLLFATFMGPQLSRQFTGQVGDADRIGMNVVRYDAPWDEGGPMVLHAPWWIRAHWGRAFEIVELRESGFGASDEWAGHGTVLLRRRDVRCTPELLETPEPGEPRETVALAASLRDQWREIGALRAALAGGSDEKELAEARARADQLEEHLQIVTTSRSWRLTEPLRRAAGIAREKLG